MLPIEAQYFKALFDLRLAQARRSETGASAVEWVLITLALIGIAAAVAGLIASKIQAKASSIDLG